MVDIREEKMNEKGKIIKGHVERFKKKLLYSVSVLPAIMVYPETKVQQKINTRK